MTQEEGKQLISEQPNGANKQKKKEKKRNEYAGVLSAIRLVTVSLLQKTTVIYSAK